MIELTEFESDEKATMSWPEFKVKSWDDFVKFVDEVIPLGNPLLDTYMFRGQPDSSWPLATSLRRRLPKGITSQDAVDIEKLLLQEFKSQAHLHVNESILPTSRADLLGWWTLMQHHSAPTRLLDWTTSAYVAIYFAIDQHWGQDGAVWLFNSQSVANHADNTYNNGNRRVLTISQQQNFFWNPNATDEPLLLQSGQRSERIVAQQGRFFVCGQILANYDDVMEGAIKSEENQNQPSDWYRKVIIPGDLKPEFLARLRTFNITASSLFPGLDGLGRSITEAARLAGAQCNN